MAAATALASESVDLVDKNDAGRELSSFRKEVSDTRSAESGEFLLEARAGCREKRYTRFFGRCSREQCLAGSRRSIKQNAARNTSTEAAEPFRIAQELDRFRQLGARFIHSGHV